jgi:hypothetical protein
MSIRPKAFLSYSHNDKNEAIKIAEALRAGGIEIWLDRWEILPGDSLIQKIFEEGLAGADAFLVLISKNSILSPWVRQELDVAMIKRIEGITRIIPLVLDGVQPPDVKDALQAPAQIRLSRSDSSVYLSYRQERTDRWICAVAKRLNDEGFLITAYPTEAIKEGVRVWPK